MVKKKKTEIGALFDAHKKEGSRSVIRHIPKPLIIELIKEYKGVKANVMRALHYIYGYTLGEIYLALKEDLNLKSRSYVYNNLKGPFVSSEWFEIRGKRIKEVQRKIKAAEAQEKKEMGKEV